MIRYPHVDVGESLFLQGMQRQQFPVEGRQR
jgi:hypothetical protein